MEDKKRTALIKEDKKRTEIGREEPTSWWRLLLSFAVWSRSSVVDPKTATYHGGATQVKKDKKEKGDMLLLL